MLPTTQPMLRNICIVVLCCLCKTAGGNCPVSGVILQNGLKVPCIPASQHVVILSHTGIHVLQFQPFSELRKLDVSSNEIEYIRTNTFHDTKYLEDLDVSNNKIIAVNRNTFNGSFIEHLNLRNNQITVLVSESFGGLEETLEFLYLAFNNLTELLPGVFRGLQKLKVIDLSSNKLTTINQEDFTGLPVLSQLFLQENRLVVFYGWQSSLSQLNLANNSITTVKMPQNTTTVIDMTDNLLLCSCENKEFLTWCLSSPEQCFVDFNCTEWIDNVTTLPCDQTTIESPTTTPADCSEWIHKLAACELSCNQTKAQSSTHSLPIFITAFLAFLVFTIF